MAYRSKSALAEQHGVPLLSFDGMRVTVRCAGDGKNNLDHLFWKAK